MRITETQLRELIHESIREVILEMSPTLLSQDVVIKQFNDKHGKRRYDYSKVKYKNDRT